MRKQNLTGQTFNLLTVVSEAVGYRDYAHWHCRCSCGNTCIVAGKALKGGNTKSCGCYQVKRAIEANTTHGGASRRQGEHRLYTMWATMRQRCEQPSSNRYYIYGARGIKVCDRWQNFANFLEDMGSTFKEGLSIERKDNNGNYCKENCVWATRKQQARNMSTNRYLTFNGKTMILADWAKELCISHAAIIRRIDAGWSLADALTKHAYEIKHPNYSLPTSD